MEGKTARLAVVCGLPLAAALPFLVVLVPGGPSLMILLAHADWWHLTNEILGCENSEDDWVSQVLLVDELELYFLGDQVPWVVALPVGALADWHHRFDVVGVVELGTPGAGRGLHQGASERGRPNVPGHVVFTDALFSGVLESVID